VKIQAMNGTDDQITLTALKQAASKATGKARATIQGVLDSLLSQPAARGRSAKGASVKKHTKRAAKRTARRKSNPTRAAQAPKAYGYHRKRATRHNPTKAAGGFGGKLNTGAILEVMKEGGLVALGALGSSFIERQSEKMLPDLNPSIRTIGASAVVAGAALYFGGKTLGKNIAVGAITEGIRSLGRTFMPSVFAGTEGEDEGVSGVTGYWDENGQWIETSEAQGIEGLAYDPSYPAPNLALRPEGV
jgi:hypothetical protein